MRWKRRSCETVRGTKKKNRYKLIRADYFIQRKFYKRARSFPLISKKSLNFKIKVQKLEGRRPLQHAWIFSLGLYDCIFSGQNIIWIWIAVWALKSGSTRPTLGRSWNWNLGCTNKMGWVVIAAPPKHHVLVVKHGFIQINHKKSSARPDWPNGRAQDLICCSLAYSKVRSGLGIPPSGWVQPWTHLAFFTQVFDFPSQVESTHQLGE